MTIRLIAAVAALVSAAFHFKLWLYDGYNQIEVVGPAFLLNAVAGLFIAVGLILWRHWLPLLFAAGFGASTLGAFVISTTVGLFGVHEQWAGAIVWTAAISEAVAIVAGLLGIWREGYLSANRPGHQGTAHRSGHR